MNHFLGALLALDFNEGQELPFLQLLDFTGAVDHVQKDQLLELPELFELKDELNSSFNSSLAALDWLNDLCQKTFLRDHASHKLSAPAFKVERQQLTNSHWHLAHLDIMLKLFDHLGFMQEIQPLQNHYDAALLLGASEKTVESRLALLEEMLSHGVTIDNIYLLGGQRDLWFEREELAKILLAQQLVIKRGGELRENIQLVNEKVTWLLDGALDPKDPALYEKRQKIINYFTKTEGLNWPTESDMMQKLLLEKSLTSPSFLHINIVLVDTPKNALGARPNTLDTILEFRTKHAQTLLSLNLRNLIVISEQPHIRYQANLIHKHLPEFHAETVGRGLKYDKAIIPDLLDSLTRAIFVAKDGAKLRLASQINGYDIEVEL
jgi:hypothetical protein